MAVSVGNDWGHRFNNSTPEQPFRYLSGEINAMNINKHQQRGMSGTAIVLFIFIFIFVLWIFFKLFPFYMENWAVANALQELTEEKLAIQLDDQIQRSFLDNLSAKDVELFDPKTVKQHVTITRYEGNVEIVVKYTRIKPLMGNVSLSVDFENSIKAH